MNASTQPNPDSPGDGATPPPPAHQIQNIPLAALRRRADARQLIDNVVRALVASIPMSGLINPLRVRAVSGEPDAYEIIAGCHRREAMKRLGYASAPCIVVSDNDLHAELAMIDENLMRAGLSPIQRDRATARRKEIYLALHPETKAGTAGAKARHGAANDTVSFVKSTAEAIGVSERTVERMAERGEASLATISDDDAKAVVGTALDTPSEHKALATLPAEARKPVIEAAKRGEKVSAKAALAAAKAKTSTKTRAKTNPIRAKIISYKAGDESYKFAAWIAGRASSADEIKDLRSWLAHSELGRIENELREFENRKREAGREIADDADFGIAASDRPAVTGRLEELPL